MKKILVLFLFVIAGVPAIRADMDPFRREVFEVGPDQYYFYQELSNRPPLAPPIIAPMINLNFLDKLTAQGAGEGQYNMPRQLGVPYNRRAWNAAYFREVHAWYKLFDKLNNPGANYRNLREYLDGAIAGAPVMPNIYDGKKNNASPLRPQKILIHRNIHIEYRLWDGLGKLLPPPLPMFKWSEGIFRFFDARTYKLLRPAFSYPTKSVRKNEVESMPFWFLDFEHAKDLAKRRKKVSWATPGITRPFLYELLRLDLDFPGLTLSLFRHRDKKNYTIYKLRNEADRKGGVAEELVNQRAIDLLEGIKIKDGKYQKFNDGQAENLIDLINALKAKFGLSDDQAASIGLWNIQTTLGALNTTIRKTGFKKVGIVDGWSLGYERPAVVPAVAQAMADRPAVEPAEEAPAEAPEGEAASEEAAEEPEAEAGPRTYIPFKYGLYKLMFLLLGIDNKNALLAPEAPEHVVHTELKQLVDTDVANHAWKTQATQVTSGFSKENFLNYEIAELLKDTNLYRMVEATIDFSLKPLAEYDKLVSGAYQRRTEADYTIPRKTAVMAPYTQESMRKYLPGRRQAMAAMILEAVHYLWIYACWNKRISFFRRLPRLVTRPLAVTQYIHQFGAVGGLYYLAAFANYAAKERSLEKTEGWGKYWRRWGETLLGRILGYEKGEPKISFLQVWGSIVNKLHARWAAANVARRNWMAYDGWNGFVITFDPGIIDKQNNVSEKINRKLLGSLKATCIDSSYGVDLALFYKRKGVGMPAEEVAELARERQAPAPVVDQPAGQQPPPAGVQPPPAGEQQQPGGPRQPPVVQPQPLGPSPAIRYQNPPQFLEAWKSAKNIRGGLSQEQRRELKEDMKKAKKWGERQPGERPAQPQVAQPQVAQPPAQAPEQQPPGPAQQPEPQVAPQPAPVAPEVQALREQPQPQPLTDDERRDLERLEGLARPLRQADAERLAELRGRRDQAQAQIPEGVRELRRQIEELRAGAGERERLRPRTQAEQDRMERLQGLRDDPAVPLDDQQQAQLAALEARPAPPAPPGPAPDVQGLRDELAALQAQIQVLREREEAQANPEAIRRQREEAERRIRDIALDLRQEERQNVMWNAYQAGRFGGLPAVVVPPPVRRDAPREALVPEEAEGGGEPARRSVVRPRGEREVFIEELRRVVPGGVPRRVALVALTSAELLELARLEAVYNEGLPLGGRLSVNGRQRRTILRRRAREQVPEQALPDPLPAYDAARRVLDRGMLAGEALVGLGARVLPAVPGREGRRRPPAIVAPVGREPAPAGRAELFRRIERLGRRVDAGAGLD